MRPDRANALVAVEHLDMAFDDRVLQRDVTFEVEAGQIFVVMGASGSGKSTLLRHMMGLIEPRRGDVLYQGSGFWAADEAGRQAIRRRLGVLFQSAALWSSMTVGENVALPLTQFTSAPPDEVEAIVSLKLSLVGLGGAEGRYPAELSGGMRKRAGLARALALDADLLFLDEPSAGLDPIGAKHLDDLILELRDSLGATFVIVSHELASIFAIADDSIFLDAETRTPIARGNPRRLLNETENPTVREFLTRGRSADNRDRPDERPR